MMPTVAVLAGGRATRLGALAADTAKSLIDVNGRPFAVHQLARLEQQGLTDVVFLVGHLGPQIEAALGGGTPPMRIRYAFDGPRPLGTGGAIRQALPLLTDPFMVLYGDSYLECDFNAVHDTHRAGGRHGLMTVYRNDDRLDRSNVQYSGGAILRYDKQDRTPDMRHIDYGLGVLSHAAFDARRAGEVFDLADVYQDLVAAGQLAGYEVTSRFYEIGSPEGLGDLRSHLASTATPAEGTTH